MSSRKVQSVWQQLQSTYLSQGSIYLLCICTRIHKQLHQSKERKSYLTCLRHCKTVQTPVKKKHENKLATKFPVSFQNTVQNSFHYLHSSGRFHWLTTCPNQTHSQLQFKSTSLATWCIWEIKSTFPNRQTQLTPLSTHSLNTKFHCALSAMTVPISLSLSTLVPILPGKQQCFRLQSQGHQSVQTSVKLQFLHTTEPQVFNYSRITLQMWQLNQGHWQSKLDPPWFSCQRFSNLWQLNQVTDLSGFSCQTFSTQRQLNQGYWPSVVLMPIFLNSLATKPRSPTLRGSHAKPSQLQLSSPGMTPGSVAPRTARSVRPESSTTWPTCRDVTLSYITFLIWTYAAPCRPAHFLSNSFPMLSSDSPGTLSHSLPQSPSFLVS